MIWPIRIAIFVMNIFICGSYQRVATISTNSRSLWRLFEVQHLFKVYVSLLSSFNYSSPPSSPPPVLSFLPLPSSFSLFLYPFSFSLSFLFTFTPCNTLSSTFYAFSYSTPSLPSILKHFILRHSPSPPPSHPPLLPFPPLLPPPPPPPLLFLLLFIFFFLFPPIPPSSSSSLTSFSLNSQWWLDWLAVCMSSPRSCEW